MRLLLLLALFSLGGCVKPWQRELLAQPSMRFDPRPDDAIDQHMLEAREASSGGFSASGGGCGCN